MIGRRAFMAALGIAPIAAKTAISEGHMPMVDSASGQAGPMPEIDRELNKAHRHLDRLRQRHFEKLQRGSQGFPPPIAGMKSWSPVFKTHVLEQEERRIEHLDDFWNLEPAEIIKLALKNGLKP